MIDIWTWRGHRIICPKGVFLYADTQQPVPENKDRPCGHCGAPNTPEGHDGCLGTIPGAMNACCGHGIQSDAYIQFWSGGYLQGADAEKYIESLKTGGDHK